MGSLFDLDMIAPDDIENKSGMTPAQQLDKVFEAVRPLIVRRDEIVGRGRNRRERGKTALGHGEIEAIGEACRNLGGWRLWECTLYVTLEPCPMCAGAIINARIPRVVFGASDAKCGACGSVCNLFSMEFNHHPVVEKGIREAECGALLTEFFQNLRLELRTRPKWKRPE